MRESKREERYRERERERDSERKRERERARARTLAQERERMRERESVDVMCVHARDTGIEDEQGERRMEMVVWILFQVRESSLLQIPFAILKCCPRCGRGRWPHTLKKPCFFDPMPKFKWRISGRPKIWTGETKFANPR